jgi:hypothetical protein
MYNVGELVYFYSKVCQVSHCSEVQTVTDVLKWRALRDISPDEWGSKFLLNASNCYHFITVYA